MTKIVVADLERCGDFYRSVGGFDLSEDVVGDGFREIILRRSDRSTWVSSCSEATPAPLRARPCWCSRPKTWMQ